MALAWALALWQASPAHAQLNEQAKLVASDASALDDLGYLSSISGDTIVVGAYKDDDAGGSSGSAYVFVDDGTGWSEQAKLTASDAAAGDWFGYSVWISGDTAVVGAPEDDHPAVNAGSAYVFVRSGTTWTQQAKLVASDANFGDEFGAVVAISGDTIAVGAIRDDTVGGTNAGSVYVFVRSGTTWTQQAKLRASDGAAEDWFCICALSEDENTMVVGSIRDDHVGGADAGSVYVYVRSGTTWSEQAKLVASDAAAGDQFGFFTAVSGDTALIGALTADTGAGADAGAAYVFVRSGTTWSEQAKLTASDAAAGDQLGFGVAISGDTALVGAWMADLAAGADAGAAYLYERSGASWTEQAKLEASDAGAGDRFGTGVAISGDLAVVPAYRDDNSGGADAGSAYVFCLAEAAASSRNSGPNPASYTCTLPVLGGTFMGTVDLSTTGHSFARLFARTTPIDVTLAGGQHLLCGGTSLGVLGPVAGPLAVFSVPIPNTSALCGLSICTQALHLGGVTPFSLSNAQDLVVGH